MKPTHRHKPLTVFRALLWIFATTCVTSPGAPRPNIVMILADDMGWDISALGNPFSSTPRLDQFVAEARSFDHFYVASPVCSPARASLLTGINPGRLGVHNFIGDEVQNHNRSIVNHLDPDVTTVADLCKRAGYRTGHFGKWHLGKGQTAAAPDLDEYGFDEFRISWPHGNNTNRFSSHLVADRAEQFIDESQGQPFYLQVWQYQMHTPLVATAERMAEIDPSSFDPEEFSEPMRDYLSGADRIDNRVQTYFGCLLEFDAAVGRILDAIDDRGLAENTLVVFCSDNGPASYWDSSRDSNPALGSSGEFRGRKGSLLEGGIRVPMAVRWPGRVPPGIDRSSTISSVDWLPTIASLLGEPIAPRLDGEDRGGVFFGEPAPRERPLYWDLRGVQPRHAMREGKWKFVWNGTDMAGGQLYDVDVDPGEAHDLAPLLPGPTASMRTRVSTWVAELNDSPPVIEAQPEPLEIDAGVRADFAVASVGYPYPTFRWYRDGSPLEDGARIVGSNTSMLSIIGALEGDEADYHCEVYNRFGNIMTQAAALSVRSPARFTLEPEPQVVQQGGAAVFEAVAGGDPQLSFQWFRSGVAIVDGPGVSGSNSSTLTLSDLDPEDSAGGADGYRCAVANAFGTDLTGAVGVLVLGDGDTINYDSWSAFHFGTLETASAAGSDPDGDGAINLLEYAFVTHPFTANARPQFSVDRSGDSAVKVTFQRWANATVTGAGSSTANGVSYELQSSLDGETWSVASDTTLLEVTPSPDLSTETVSYDVNVPGSDDLFLIRCAVSFE